MGPRQIEPPSAIHINKIMKQPDVGAPGAHSTVHILVSNMKCDFNSINRAALATLPAVLVRILPGGKRVGGEYVVRNPLRHDRRPGSFKINMRSGRWSDFAVQDARGGDIISLVAYLEGVSQGKAARLLGAMLGVGGVNE